MRSLLNIEIVATSLIALLIIFRELPGIHFFITLILMVIGTWMIN